VRDMGTQCDTQSSGVQTQRGTCVRHVLACQPPRCHSAVSLHGSVWVTPTTITHTHRRGGRGLHSGQGRHVVHSQAGGRGRLHSRRGLRNRLSCRGRAHIASQRAGDDGASAARHRAGLHRGSLGRRGRLGSGRGSSRRLGSGRGGGSGLRSSRGGGGRGGSGGGSGGSALLAATHKDNTRQRGDVHQQRYLLQQRPLHVDTGKKT
jgi:hypothetical protein